MRLDAVRGASQASGVQECTPHQLGPRPVGSLGRFGGRTSRPPARPEIRAQLPPAAQIAVTTIRQAVVVGSNA
jgi:hypothetical protein